MSHLNANSLVNDNHGEENKVCNLICLAVVTPISLGRGCCNNDWLTYSDRIVPSFTEWVPNKYPNDKCSDLMRQVLKVNWLRLCGQRLPMGSQNLKQTNGCDQTTQVTYYWSPDAVFRVPTNRDIHWPRVNISTPAIPSHDPLIISVVQMVFPPIHPVTIAAPIITTDPSETWLKGGMTIVPT